MRDCDWLFVCVNDGDWVSVGVPVAEDVCSWEELGASECDCDCVDVAVPPEDEAWLSLVVCEQLGVCICERLGF